MSAKKIAVIFGTRPEIIKLSPVIRLLQKRRRPYFLIHTGQHYSYEMDRIFFRDLELPEPKYRFSEKSKSGLQSDHTGRMMSKIEQVLLKERPGVALVQGDTNSVLAGSLVVSKIGGMKLGHVEAGLRSYDRQMPEEVNRIISDHVSHYLFAPTKPAGAILLKEGIESGKIHVTGNTIVDAVKQNLELARKKKFTPQIGGKPYFLMTLHRQENVDFKDRLASILKGVERVCAKFRTPVLFPAHPRTVQRLKEHRLRLPEGVRLVPPAGFLEFLVLEAGAGLLLSDSGGLQEEGCILKVPCVTLRTSTERPETVQVGANLIAGYKPADILKCAEKMTARKRTWKNPFGDGHSAERILDIVAKDKL